MCLMEKQIVEAYLERNNIIALGVMSLCPTGVYIALEHVHPLRYHAISSSSSGSSKGEVSNEPSNN